MELLSEAMKDIPLPMPVVRGIQIETKSDAYQVVWDKYSLQRYLNRYGDVEVEWDSECKVYRVPAFRAERVAGIATTTTTMYHHQRRER